MIIAERIHLFPSRTQKLSSPALKILGGKLPGKLGSRRFFLFLENVNDEGTAPSLAAGAVPFLIEPLFFPLLDISTLKKIAIGVQLYV